jgi:hypothetical protein
MFSRSIAVAALLLSTLPAAAFAQAPTAHDKEQDARLDALQKRLTAAETGLTSLKTDLEKKLSDLTGNVQTLADLVKEQSGQIGTLKTDRDTLKADLDKLTTTINTQTADIGKLRGDLGSLTTTANSELDLVRQTLNDIARPDSAGGHVPRLDAAMKSPAFQQELQQAVHVALPKKGLFRIVNKMSTAQWIYVNLAGHYLQPGEVKTLELPLGTVTTQLPGQEIVNWTLAHKGDGVYAESIDIVPTPTPTRTFVEYTQPLYSTTTLLPITYP